MKLSATMGGVAASLLLAAISIQAQTYTNAFPGITFAKPVWFGEVPGKPETFFVLEQHQGNITALRKQGSEWIKENVWKVGVNTANEMGLLGFAFHPNFQTNRKYYVNYNPSSGGLATVIEERQVDATFLKDAGVSRQILRFTQPYNNHNGGTLEFGPRDGFLYIGTGDGGSGGDPQGNAQNRNSLLGKMLRIDVDRKADGKEYAIPSDNPFVAGGGSPEIYAWGLRNPWKWAFDRVTGDLWLADVGQNAQEEVDIIVRNGDYGWKNAEGYSNNGAGVTGPVFAYPRADGTSITGGFVFRGATSSKHFGKYIVGDYGSSNMWALKSNGHDARATVEQLADAPNAPATFGTDSRGHLYVLGHGNGIVYRFDGADWQPQPTGLIHRAGNLRQAIGCIFYCKPGSRLDAKAFADGAEVELFGMTGGSHGRITAASGEVPASLKAGMYILKSSASAKPSLLVVQ